MVPQVQISAAQSCTKAKILPIILYFFFHFTNLLSFVALKTGDDGYN